MAVNDSQDKKADSKCASASTIRVATAFNVLFAVVLAGGLVAAVQWGSYRFNDTFDLTSSKVNSLSSGTDTLLDTLDEDVTITSMYYTTDPDYNKKFRETVADLIELYRIAQPSKITTHYINPISDHKEKKEFFLELAEIPKFQEQSSQYKTIIDEYEGSFGNEIRSLLENQKQKAEQLMQDYPSGYDATLLGAILQYDRELLKLVNEIDQTTIQVQGTGVPNWKLVTEPLTKLYYSIAHLPDSLSKPAMEKMLAQMKLVLNDLSPDVAGWIEKMDQPFADVVPIAEERYQQIQTLPELQIETLVAGDPTLQNMIFVQTKNDAYSLTFDDIWTNPAGDTGRPKYEDMLFLGEQRLSAAILRVTQEERTAVVFARFGGKPLFFGPEAPYGRMLGRLNELNFTVHDWDLSRSLDPPELAATASKVVYVILAPTPPKPSMLPGQEPVRFGVDHLTALLKALGEEPHALFIAGWSPISDNRDGIAAPYEYRDYLEGVWGISVDTDTLLLQTVASKPGEFRFQTMAWNIVDLEMSDQAIVQDIHNQRLVLPWASPLKVPQAIPDGVSLETLCTVPEKDTIWGVHDLDIYQRQLADKKYVTRDPMDTLGPFTVGIAATRKTEDAGGRIVVISSKSFAEDAVALGGGLEMIGNNYVQVNPAPGNQTLFFNALFWLTDQSDWMNMGRPPESHTLQIGSGSDVAAIRTFVYVIWPGLALLCGLFVWWSRRR